MKNMETKWKHATKIFWFCVNLANYLRNSRSLVFQMPYKYQSVDGYGRMAMDVCVHQRDVLYGYAVLAHSQHSLVLEYVRHIFPIRR